MIIQHNMEAANAQRQYKINVGEKSRTVEKLSSGYRINRAADDAAGLVLVKPFCNTLFDKYLPVTSLHWC